MHCFIRPMPFNCCCNRFFGFPPMGFGMGPFFGGGCGREAFKIAAGTALGLGTAAVIGSVINRLC